MVKVRQETQKNYRGKRDRCEEKMEGVERMNLTSLKLINHRDASSAKAVHIDKFFR